MTRIKRLLLGVVVVAAMLLPLSVAAVAKNWVEAGPIWNDFDAQRKCPKACGGDKWDGNWKTTVQGRMSVCACSGKSRSRTFQADAGPIWNNYDAERKCPKACGGARWDGNWRTVVPGRNSTCDCER